MVFNDISGVNFHSILENSFKLHRDRIFLDVFCDDNFIQKKYSDLETDIRLRSVQIKNAMQNYHAEVVVCVGKNSYENIVNILTGIFLNIPVLPISSTESVDRINDKIQSINLNTIVVFDDNENKILTLGPAQSLVQVAQPLNQILLLMFSSGTTGLPKIALLSDVSVCANAEALILHHGLSSESVIVTPLPIYHVNALCFSLFCSLMVGGKLVLIDGLNLKALKQALYDNSVHILSIVPAYLKIIYENSAQLDFKKIHLKYILSAAAPLSVELVVNWYNKTKIRIIQGYGMCEAVNFSTILDINLNEKQYLNLMTGQKFPTIGHSILHSKVDIITDSGYPAEEGEIGTIALGGICLLSGYLNQTVEKTMNESLLTGDLGFYKKFKGIKYFFITGRKKEIIKKSGIAISLREIDEFLSLKIDNSNDVISVPIADDVMGENFGLIFSYPITISEFESLIKLLTEYFGHHYSTKKYICTKVELRSASGKAKRFELSSMFF